MTNITGSYLVGIEKCSIHPQRPKPINIPNTERFLIIFHALERGVMSRERERNNV